MVYLEDLVGYIVLFVVLALLYLFGYGLVQVGITYENTRLYEKCLIEQQDKTHKDAVELCKERTKE